MYSSDLQCAERRLCRRDADRIGVAHERHARDRKIGDESCAGIQVEQVVQRRLSALDKLGAERTGGRLFAATIRRRLLMWILAVREGAHPFEEDDLAFRQPLVSAGDRRERRGDREGRALDQAIVCRTVEDAARLASGV